MLTKVKKELEKNIKLVVKTRDFKNIPTASQPQQKLV